MFLRTPSRALLLRRAFSSTTGSASTKKGAASANPSPPVLYADFGRLSSSQLKMGIVGMANVGKSSTFNLISKQSVPAENFPFCTIDPNVAIVQVPDARFDQLANIFNPESLVPATLQVTDIAGLVRGASEGEGLGNEFLSHIKNVDGIFQVVRAFEDDKILHTEGEMNPTRDLGIILSELIAKDVQVVQKHLKEAEKKAKRTADGKADFEALQKADALLRAKKWLRFEPKAFTPADVQNLNKFGLLSTKPITFLLNESRKDYVEKRCRFVPEIKQWLDENGFGGGRAHIIEYSVEHEQAVEKAIAEGTATAGDAKNDSIVDKVIVAGYELLNLIRFFTVGADEVRAWTIKAGTKAPQAAATIHSDFEKGFISAEVLAYDKFMAFSPAERVEKLRKVSAKQGKDYVIQDGDIIHFKCKITR